MTEELLPRDAGDACQLQLIDPLRKRSEREIWLLIQFQEAANDAIYHLNGIVWARSVLPEHLGGIPPPRLATDALVDKGLAVPDGCDIAPRKSSFEVIDRQVEVTGSIVHDMVYVHKDGCTQFNRECGRVKRIDSQCAAANPVRLFEHCDVDIDVLLLGVFL